MKSVAQQFRSKTKLVLDFTLKQFLRNAAVFRGSMDFATATFYKRLIKDLAIDFVVDVGANSGQFGRFMRDEVYFKDRLISFEPVSQTFLDLAKNAADDDLWEVYQLAAGSAESKSEINVSASSFFSSIFDPIKEGSLTKYSHVESKEEITIVRLDERLSNINGRLFLKVDTQGFDLEVLRGSEKILDRVFAIQAELSIIPIYRSAPTYMEVLNEIDKLGFCISNVFPITMSGFQAVELDCIFVRKQHNLTCTTFSELMTRASSLSR